MDSKASLMQRKKECEFIMSLKKKDAFLSLPSCFSLLSFLTTMIEDDKRLRVKIDAAIFMCLVVCFSVPLESRSMECEEERK